MAREGVGREAYRGHFVMTELQTIIDTIRNQTPDRDDGCLSMRSERLLLAEAERLQAALKPFAEVGRPFIAAAVSGAFPAGASANRMKLEPLTAQEFIDAAKAVFGSKQ